MKEKWEEECNQVENTDDVEELRRIVLGDYEWPARMKALLKLPRKEQDTFIEVALKAKEQEIHIVAWGRVYDQFKLRMLYQEQKLQRLRKELKDKQDKERVASENRQE